MENPGVKNGVIAGLFIILGSLIPYFIDAKLYLNPTIQWSLMVVYIIFMWRAGTEARTLNGGFISWGEALKPIFLTGVIAALMGVIFQYVLYNFLDPSLMELQKEMSIEMIEGMSEFMGEEAAEAAIEKLEEEEFAFTVGSALTAWGGGCLIGLIPSAIIAAIIKKEDPSHTDYA